MLKTGNWVRYCIFDLATGKAEQENNFPTSNLAFLGQSERNVAIFTAGQVSTSPLLNTTFSNIAMLHVLQKGCVGNCISNNFPIF